MAAEQADKKVTKRRLRAPAETVRQRQSSTASRAEKPKKKILAPVWRAIGWPFRKIGGLQIWQSKSWRPFRLVGRWIVLVIWPPYFRKSFRELMLVTWPDWRKSWRLTFAVLAFSLVFGLAIAGVDYVLDKLFKEVLLR